MQPPLRRQFLAGALGLPALLAASPFQEPSKSDRKKRQTPRSATIHIAAAKLSPSPFDPKTILSGKPEASELILSKSTDGRVETGIWACTPGKFRWMFTTDESAIVIEGTATVALDGGETVELHPGDLAFFNHGQNSTWTIHENFRKAYAVYQPS